MSLPPIDALAFQAISHEPISRWKGGLKVTTLGGKPVLTFLTTSQMKWGEFFQFLFGMGGFSKKKVRSFLSDDSLISKIKSILFSHNDAKKSQLARKIQINLFPFEQHHHWWNRSLPASGLAAKICTPPDSAKRVHRSTLSSFQSSTEGVSDPIPILEQLLPSFDQIAEQDARYKFVQEDLRNLVITMKHVPNAPKQLLLPLVQRIYREESSQKGLAVAEARKTIADLLFLLDQHPSLVEKLDSLDHLDAMVDQALSEVRTRLRANVSKYLISFLYPMTVATLLIRPDGTLNLGFIERIKSLVDTDTKPAFAREAHSAVTQLQNDPSLCEKLRTFPTPKPGSSLDKAIHACLKVPYDTPITNLDIEKVCLASLLGWWRQDRLGNCYANSFTSYVKDTTLHWILDDLKEIAEKESVTRKIGEKSYEFPSLFRLPLGRSLVPLDLKKQEVIQVSKVRMVKNACVLLGCAPGKEEEELFDAAQQVASGGKWSLFSAFQFLAKKNGKDEDIVREARQCIDTTFQAPLLDLCENAMASMYFPPVSAPITSSVQRALFSSSLVAIFSQMARTAKLPNCTKALQSMKLDESIPLTGQEQLELENLLGNRPHSQKAEKSLKYFILLQHRIQKKFRSPAFQCLDRLVMAYAPPDSQESTESNFVLCEKTTTGIRPLSPERLGTLFVEMFYSISQSLGDPITEETKKLFQDAAPLGNQFQKAAHLTLKGKELVLKCGIGNMEGSEYVDPSPEEVYFGKSSSSVSIDISQGRASVESLLEESKFLKEKIGKSHKISLPAISHEHAFRFLPTHPTLTRAFENIEASIDLYEQQGKGLLEKPLKAFPSVEKRVKNVMRKILQRDDVEQEFLAGAATPTIGEAITQWHEAIRKRVLSLHLKKSQEDFFDLEILKGLVTDDRSYHDPFIHFSDLNAIAYVGSIPRNMHDCFWYNPMKKTWRVVRAPEGGGASENFSFEDSRFIKFELPEELHLKAFQEKHLLSLEGKVRIKLLQVENAFIKKITSLENTLSTLSQEKRGELLSLLLPPLPTTLELALKKAKEVSVKSPSTPEEALLQCRELQILSLFIRKKAIEEFASKFSEKTMAEMGIEMRSVRLGAYSAELHLLDDPESFIQWVRETAVPEPAV